MQGVDPLHNYISTHITLCQVYFTKNQVFLLYKNRSETVGYKSGFLYGSVCPDRCSPLAAFYLRYKSFINIIMQYPEV